MQGPSTRLPSTGSGQAGRQNAAGGLDDCELLIMNFVVALAGTKRVSFARVPETGG